MSSSTVIDASTSSDTGEALMTAEERRLFDKERSGFFKGTISLMVIYGTFILIMSLIGILSEKGREAIFVNGFTFSVTFIGGTILVILLLLVQLLTYKVPKKTAFTGEDISCPDYWELKKTPQEVLDSIDDSRVRTMSTFYCENPADKLNRDIVLPTGTTDMPLPDEVDRLKMVVDNYNIESIKPSYHMQCNRFYPEYMAYMDRAFFPANPTVMRCEYLKQCANANVQVDTKGNAYDRKITWTGVCPGEAGAS